jgi:putative ABC transport system permease protein
MRIQHVLRRLLHAPAFTFVAVATLAIGIAANAAIFTVVDGVLLQPLSYLHPDELVAVDHTAPGIGIKNVGAAPFLYFTYREDGRTFQEVGLWNADSTSVTGLAEPEQVHSLDVTASVLPILGIQPALGRWFSAQDDVPDAPRTVVLTYGYWRAKFGGDPTAVGRLLLLDGNAHEIIGVMPERFRFLDLKPALLVPMRLKRAETYLGNFSFSAVARLKPGVTVAEAGRDVGRMIPLALVRFPPFPGYTAKMFEDARLAPMVRPLKDALIGDIASMLGILMGTIGMVLLIACANVANLMLVRTEARQQELAIRAALGANPWRIARELLLESVTLALAGGVLGVGLAWGAVRILTTLAPADLPRVDAIAVNGPVLLFTLAIALLSGLLFGSIPVFKYVRPHLNAALRAGGRTSSDSRERHRARSTLVVVQVALALVLLVCSGLMIRTFRALTLVQPGFINPEQVQTVGISIPESQVSDPEKVVRMQQAILEQIAAVPGVSSVGLANGMPMSGDAWRDPIFAEDHVYGDTQIPPIRRFRFVSPGLLSTMGNRLVVGRDFTWTDVYRKHPIAMVSENMARELWHDPRAALGKRIRESLKAPWREIVGVVTDERDDGVNQPAPTVAFWPTWMDDFEGDHIFIRRSVSLAIRSSRTGSSGFLNDVSRAIWSVNPNVPLARVRTLQDMYKGSLARTSFTLVMLAIAGAMALLLGIAGVYGVISYAVSQRRREIGIRIALGARRAEVTRMFVAHGAKLTAVGLACGLVAAAALARLLASLLFDVSPFDGPTYGAMALGLAAAAVLASYVPARHATAVSPVEALRSE